MTNNKQARNKKDRIREIIDRELKYWQKAYPKNRELLDVFALKLKFELTNY